MCGGDQGPGINCEMGVQNGNGVWTAENKRLLRFVCSARPISKLAEEIAKLEPGRM